MKPMLFNTEMVQALLADRKTVTRRVIKPQPRAKLAYCCMGDKYGTWAYPDKNAWDHWGEAYKIPDHIPEAETVCHWVPPCHIGDILYVRETWAIIGTDGTHHKYGYKADNEWLVPLWRPSIHMPRDAARIFLQITGVRVERLQDIDDTGVVAEGLEIGAPFDDLWDSTIEPKGRALYGWAANPWVWVIEFEQISKREAELGGRHAQN